jgi:hypothetical protein
VPQEQLKSSANVWQTSQVPASWAGVNIIKIEIHLEGGEILTLTPTDWTAVIGNRILKMTDSEHTAAFEPFVP